MTALNLSVYLSILVFGAQAPPAISMDDVVAAWGAKEKAIGDAVFEWRDSIVVPPDKAVASLLALEAKSKGIKSQDDVLKETAYEEKWKVILSDKRWRSDYEGKVFDEKRELVSQNETSVYRDGRIVFFMPPGVHNYPKGNIHKGRPDDISHLLNGKPIFLLYRPLIAKIFQPDKSRLLPHAEAVKGKACLVLETQESADKTWEFWVSPEMGFAILKYARKNHGKVLYEANFEYKQNKSVEWVPIGWRIVTATAKGAISQSTVAKLTRCELRAAIDPSMFDDPFPAWCVLQDFTAPSQRYDNTMFLLRPDGSRGLIDGSDRNLPYEELLSRYRANDPSRRFIMLGAGLLFAVVLGVLLIKRLWTKRNA